MQAEDLVSVLSLSGVEMVTPRRYVPISAAEREFLRQAALQAQYMPDYSSGAISEARYFAKLTDVTLQGDTGAILHRGQMVVESMMHMKKCVRSPGYRRKRHRQTVEKKGLYTSIFFLPEALGNVYHWLVDCLPRLRLLENLPTQSCSLICHAGMSEYQWITLKSIVSSFPHLRIELMPREEDWLLENYVFLGFASGLNSGFLDADALDFLGRGLLPLCKRVPVREGRRIHLSRRLAPTRRLVNQREVGALLDSLGFEEVQLELMSIAEQIACFRDTALVVGVHGAGLANLIFANRCGVIEIQARNRLRPHYLLLAKACAAPYCALVGSADDARGDFAVDTGILHDLIVEALREREGIILSKADSRR